LKVGNTVNDTIDIQNILLAVIFSALGIIIPMILHLFGLGSVFLPMFLPLAVGGFLLSPRNALLVGFVTPLLSALLTGMPPFYPPIAIVMAVELAMFCFVISILRNKTALPLVVILTVAVVVDRIFLLLLYSVIMPLFQISFKAFALYDLLKSFPGIILIFILVPIMVPSAQKILKNNSLQIYELTGNDKE